MAGTALQRLDVRMHLPTPTPAPSRGLDAVKVVALPLLDGQVVIERDADHEVPGRR